MEDGGVHGDRHGGRQFSRHGGAHGGQHRHQHGNSIWWKGWSRGWLIGPKLLDPKLTRFAHLLSFASLLYKREIAQGGQTFLDLVRSNILQKFLISRRKDTVAKKRGGKNDKWNYHKTIIGTRITMKKFRVRNNIWKCVSDYNITLSCTKLTQFDSHHSNIIHH